MRPWIQALPLAWFAIVCTVARPAAGQVQVARWIMGGGAGTFSGGNSRILASLGQPAVGQSTEASATLWAGFGEEPLPLRAPDLVALNGATVADDTPALPWSTVYGASGYVLSWSQSSGFSSEDTVEVTDSQYTFPTSLAPGTYYWRVQATHCNRAASTYSAADSFVITAAPPPPPPPPPVNPVAVSPSEDEETESIAPSRIRGDRRCGYARFWWYPTWR